MIRRSVPHKLPVRATRAPLSLVVSGTVTSLDSNGPRLVLKAHVPGRFHFRFPGAGRQSEVSAQTGDIGLGVVDQHEPG